MANSVFLYAVIYCFIVVVGFPRVPRTIDFFQSILLLGCISSSRLLVRYWLGEEYDLILKGMHRPKALIYGTGNSGRELQCLSE